MKYICGIVVLNLEAEDMLMDENKNWALCYGDFDNIGWDSFRFLIR